VTKLIKKNYYQILGIPPNATSDEIRQAYRRAAVRYHPDKNPNDRTAEDKFKEISEAYGVLSNPNTRREYDRLEGFSNISASSRRNMDPVNSKSTINDIFNDLFKNKPSRKFNDKNSSAKKQESSVNRNTPIHHKKKGSNLQRHITVSFRESILGGEAMLQINRDEPCQKCNGEGIKSDSTKAPCPRCIGTGKVKDNDTCPRCRGTGIIIHQPCITCSGWGVTEKERKLKVKIPHSIEEGKSLRLAGQGHSGPLGGNSGDLIVEIRISPDPFFEKDGNDLRAEVPISFAKAVLGGQVKIPTLNESVVFSIPKGTQPGHTFRLKGLGVCREDQQAGDLLITVSIDVPRTVNNKQEQLLQKLLDLEEQN